MSSRFVSATAEAMTAPEAMAASHSSSEAMDAPESTEDPEATAYHEAMALEAAKRRSVDRLPRGVSFAAGVKARDAEQAWVPPRPATHGTRAVQLKAGEQRLAHHLGGRQRKTKIAY